MEKWDTSTWVSILALVVSGFSFLAAVWAAWVSHRTLGHAQTVHQEERRLSFERERSQLLEVVNTSKLLLERTRIKIGTVKARFDAAPQPVQVILKNHTELFTEYLPRVEAGGRQCDSLWREIAEWDPDTGIQALVRHQAKFRALVNEDQIAHDQGLFLVGVFEEKMAQAMEYVSNARR
jgi:hypothetical protein